MGHPNANCSTANVAMHEAFFWNVCSVCVGGGGSGGMASGVGVHQSHENFAVGKTLPILTERRIMIYCTCSMPRMTAAGNITLF